MREGCANGTDPSVVKDRFLRFLTDRETDAVTGIRRMSRQDTVDMTVTIAREAGLEIARPEDADRSTAIIILDHWSELDGFRFDMFPDADVIYGQDLCHQVPAIVRFRK